MKKLAFKFYIKNRIINGDIHYNRILHIDRDLVNVLDKLEPFKKELYLISLQMDLPNSNFKHSRGFWSDKDELQDFFNRYEDIYKKFVK
jgi:hypothetical protein